MNFSNKSFILICGLAIASFCSCKKSLDTITPPPAPVETVKLSIRLGGDINVIETPLGGRMQGNNAARDLSDSTVYVVDVRDGLTPYAAGIFNRTGTITLEVPKNSTYTINVAAIKKGTSAGLFWGWTSGNYIVYPSPFNRRVMNELEYANAPNLPYALDPAFMASMSYLTVRADSIWGGEEQFHYSELDSYFATTSLTVGDTAVAVNIPLKRISFGIQYHCDNFNEGMLIAEYDSLIKPLYFESYLNNINTTSFHIYTADAYRFGDDLGTEKIHLTLKWRKPDGRIFTVGETHLTPKRNSLTTINVTLPAPNNVRGLIELTDTTFAGNEETYF